MMIDWEDKQPSPPLSFVERGLLIVILPVTIYNSVIPFVTLSRWIASLIW